LRPDRAPLLIFLFALLLGLTFQGSRGLWEPDEGRNVNIALGMLQTSDWMVPRLSGEPYLDKPPLHFWTVAAGMALFGRNEWGARAGQALLFALTVLLVGALGHRLWNDRKTGRLAAVVYATSLAPFAAANVVTPDTTLAACVVLLVYAWWRAETAAAPRARFGWWLLAGVAVGLGALAKGPAILLFVAPLGLHLLLRRRLVAVLREPGAWVGAGVSLLIAASWYATMFHRLPGAAAYLLDNQVVGRLFTSTYRRNPGLWGAAETYVPILTFGLFPWALWWLGRGRSLAAGRLRGLLGFLRWSSTSQLLVLWIVCPLLVLLAASSRLPLYVLPLFAPAALATARGMSLAALRRTAQGEDRRPRRLAVAVLAAWCLALLALKGFAAQWEGGRDSRRYARWLANEAVGAPPSVVAVKVPMYGLPLYGFTDVRSVVLEGEGYPMFIPQRTLAATIPELTADTPTPFIVVQEKNAQITQALLARAGLACQIRPPRHRLALLVCQPPSPAGPRP
jgi:4-amino-4-deoxy-L-arabinose transferase